MDSISVGDGFFMDHVKSVKDVEDFIKCIQNDIYEYYIIQAIGALAIDITTCIDEYCFNTDMISNHTRSYFDSTDSLIQNAKNNLISSGAFNFSIYWHHIKGRKYIFWHSQCDKNVQAHIKTKGTIRPIAFTDGKILDNIYNSFVNIPKNTVNIFNESSINSIMDEDVLTLIPSLQRRIIMLSKIVCIQNINSNADITQQINTASERYIKENLRLFNSKYVKITKEVINKPLSEI